MKTGWQRRMRKKIQNKHPTNIIKMRKVVPDFYIHSVLLVYVWMQNVRDESRAINMTGNALFNSDEHAEL